MSDSIKGLGPNFQVSSVVRHPVALPLEVVVVVVGSCGVHLHHPVEAVEPCPRWRPSVHPGVGVDLPGDQGERHLVAYYQWVPFVLFLQVLQEGLQHPTSSGLSLLHPPRSVQGGRGREGEASPKPITLRPPDPLTP